MALIELNEVYKLYCWFSHDVTKIRTTKLSMLLRFYFHVVLEKLRTNVQKIFASKEFLVL